MRCRGVSGGTGAPAGGAPDHSNMGGGARSAKGVGCKNVDHLPGWLVLDSVLPRTLDLPLRPLLAALTLLLFSAPVAGAGESVLHQVHEDLDSGLDAGQWSQLGSGHALDLQDGSLLINDNAASDRIAFQTLLGEIEADHRVELSARVYVVSNLGGRGAVLEVARPGLEVVLRMFPDHVELVEREAGGRFGWLASAPVDLSEFRDLLLVKRSSKDPRGEGYEVHVDGQLLLEAMPRQSGALGVGRIILGATGYGDMGASVWDWVDLRVTRPQGSGVAVESSSFGALKSRF